MKETISLDELSRLSRDDYTLIDMRTAAETEYGVIDGAVNIPGEELETAELKNESFYIVYCKMGLLSVDMAARLRARGYDAVSLEGGYLGWLREIMSKEQDNALTAKKARESILTAYRESIWLPFLKAVEQYSLVKAGDSIAVCISGGKDSMLMATLFSMLKERREIDFDLTFLVMDPGYNEQNRKMIEENAKRLGIKIDIFESDIFQSVYTVEKNPCYLCARMRRGHLYKNAQDRGCNKIALGHHFDDVIETILMSMLYSGQTRTMMPRLKSENFEGMQLIRPLYLINERDIKSWRDENGLHFIACACKFTEGCETCGENGETVSKRLDTKRLIERLEPDIPNIRQNIFNSVVDVELEKLINR